MRHSAAFCFAVVVSVSAVGCGSSDSTSPDGDTGGTPLTGPGATWTPVTPSSGTSSWFDVAYGNGVWVAVGNGYRASSTTGTTWTSAAVPSSYYAQRYVFFANGLFVSTSGLGLGTSSNGTSWSNQLQASTTTFSDADAQNLAGIAYGNGLWVIVDDRFLSSDVVAFRTSSTNGAGWNQVKTTIPYSQPTSVAFGNGVFVVVGYGGLVASSTNSSTWTARTLGSASDLGLLAITYADGKFVAVTNSGKAYRSTDGITWAKATVGVGALYAVAYGNGVFVATGQAGFYTSPDAVTWTKRTWTSATDFEGIAFGNSKFVAVGSNSWAISQ